MSNTPTDYQWYVNYLTFIIFMTCETILTIDVHADDYKWSSTLMYDFDKLFLSRAYAIMDSSRVSTFLISILLIVYGSFRYVNFDWLIGTLFLSIRCSVSIKTYVQHSTDIIYHVILCNHHHDEMNKKYHIY